MPAPFRPGEVRFRWFFVAFPGKTLGMRLALIPRMRVLGVDESEERAEVLRQALRHAGCEVAASLSSPIALLDAVLSEQPDVIVIDTNSPSRDVLEHVVMVTQHTPRPIVMFASDGAPDAIRDAVRAGVSAYVVDGLDPARLKTIVDVAVARFENFQKLRAQLADAQDRLAERKLVERAKGLLMKSRSLDEEAAYAALRRMAMDRKLKLGEVAQRIVDAADLLGA